MDPAPSAVPQWATDALSDVYDPCWREKGISVVDMGLLRSVAVSDGHARVGLLLTSGWCPFASRVLTEVEEAIATQPGVDSAEVEIVWDETWTTDRLSESAVRKFRFLPAPTAVRPRRLRGGAPSPGRGGQLMIGDAFVFDGVAPPFDFSPMNAFGKPGENLLRLHGMDVAETTARLGRQQAH
jgi:metal-sulfur cluster biosynthetic enzyme